MARGASPPPRARSRPGGAGARRLPPPQVVLGGSKGSSEDLMFRGVCAGIPTRGLYLPSCQWAPPWE